MTKFDDQFDSEIDDYYRRPQEHSLLESEFGDIIKWVERFKDATVKIYQEGESAVAERDKIFGILIKTAEKREDLPSIKEYFTVKCPTCEGDEDLKDDCKICNGVGKVRRKIGKYKGTITEMNAIEYVSALHQCVIKLKDTKINPTELI